MIPIQLSISGFLSYRDPVEIDFTAFNLACISGSNGSGKSSILDAITWGLFGQARTRDDAVINLQSETAEVSFVFEYENNLYRVTRAKTRGKTTLLEFHIMGADEKWKPLTERTMRGTETRVNEVLRLDYETFINASFFLQGKADQFTQQRPADRKRILSSILGLEIWEKYRKAAFEERKQVENQITELDGRLQEINNELAEEDQRRTRLEEVQTNMEAISAALTAQTRLLEEMRQKTALLKERRQIVENLSNQAQRTRLEMEKLTSRQDQRLQEKNAFAELVERADEIEQQYQSWQEARAALAQWDETAKRFNEHEKRRHAPLTEIETARTRLEAERDSLLRKSEEIEESEKESVELEGSLKRLVAETAQIQKAIKERDELDLKRQQVLQEQAKAKAENPLLKGEMDVLKNRIEQLESVDGGICPLCGQPLTPEDRERLIDELHIEGTQKGDHYRANVALLKAVTEQVEELTSAVAEYAETEDRLRDSTRMLDQTTVQIQAVQAEKAKWQEEDLPKLKEIEQQLSQKQFALDARATLAEIDKELKEIGYDAASHDAARKTEQDLQKFENEYRLLENARSTLAPLEREIKEIGEQVDQIRLTLEKQEQEHEEAAAQLAAAESEAPDLLTAERKMLELQEQENQTRMSLGAAQQNLQILGTLKIRKKELEAEREQFSNKVVEYKVLERAFGKNGVPAMLIEQALPQIETQANQILEKLSGGNMHINFVTQQEYKDSKRDDLRETLEIQISDSSGARDYEMYSGGEAFRINFAIRLALSEVLAQRAGARLQMLVVDEGFGSQDEIGRQRLVEAINIVQSDFEKILVITHIEELKEAFPNRLEVTKGPRGSKVEMIST
ncbi:MAG: SMC family ATPase [Anaerolineales bacterium]